MPDSLRQNSIVVAGPIPLAIDKSQTPSNEHKGQNERVLD